MKLIREFKYQVSKEKVFRTMDVKSDSPYIEEMDSLFEDLVAKAQRLVLPLGIYDIVRNDEKDPCFKGYSHIVYGLVSIGEGISKGITDYFNSGEYLEGMLLDHIADAIVGEVDAYLCKELFVELKDMNLGNSQRITPAENIPIEYQSEIVKVLKGEQFNITTTKGHMISPIKSTSFLFGCAQNLEPQSMKHDCSICKIKNCKWREEK